MNDGDMNVAQADENMLWFAHCVLLLPEEFVRRVAGLHAEITLTTVLLVAAALLFGGFLLLRLTEQELLDQRARGVRETLQVLAGALALPDNQSPERLPQLLAPLGGDLLAWRYYNAQSVLVTSSQSAESQDVDVAGLIQQARVFREPQMVITRPRVWLPGVETDPGSISAAIALSKSNQDRGVLWTYFSLEPLQQQLARAHRLLLLYVLLYGVVLTVFGVISMRRNVVRPVQRLQQAIGQVAAGDLETVAAETGPRELAELATSLNVMTRALRKGRDDLLRSERMASVGHLSAGMAHEIGNPLAATIGYLELLKSELPPGMQHDLVSHSLHETARIDRLVRDLLDYAAPDDAPAQPVDLAPVVQDTLRLLGHQAVFADYLLSVDCPPTLPLVAINPHKMQQVLVNLIGNARDACRAGQTISVSAAVDQEMLLIQIHDPGSGMAAATREQLFDPFFTTKAQGQGRGLGLTVCHRIITEAGGRIDVDSQLEAGSTFHLRLPLARLDQES